MQPLLAMFACGAAGGRGSSMLVGWPNAWMSSRHLCVNVRIPVVSTNLLPTMWTMQVERSPEDAMVWVPGPNVHPDAAMLAKEGCELLLRS